MYLAEGQDGVLEILGWFCELYETGEMSESRGFVDAIIVWSDEVLDWHDSGPASILAGAEYEDCGVGFLSLGVGQVRHR